MVVSGARLRYRVTDSMGERIKIGEFVPFRYSPTRFGGVDVARGREQMQSRLVFNRIDRETKIESQSGNK
jgi:hypothetical protein